MNTVQNDPGLPLGINLVGLSPHVLVYRFWTRPPGDETWTPLRDGDTVDDVLDFFETGPHADGTDIAWWVAVSGRPRTAFRFSIVITQDDHVVTGGMHVYDGTTSSHGGAVVEDAVELV
jgi:hypothetical protein